MSTSDGVLEWRMQVEDDFLKKIREVLIVDSPDVANPLVSVEGLWGLFAHEEGQRAVDVWETGGLLRWSGILYVHVRD